MDYDAIIVGAGPAGATTACWLGEAGRRILVLEKELLPRHKPCGGAVPKTVFDRFPFDFSPIVERWIERVRFRFRDGREVTAGLSGHSMAMVMRERFDLHILNHAQGEVRDGAPVTALEQGGDSVEVTTASGESFRARYVVGADGANSRVARLVGLRQERWMGAAIEAEVSVDDALLEEYADMACFIFGTLPSGYLWVFPKEEHLSVGIGIFWGKVSKMRRVLRREMERLGIEIDGAQQYGHPLPIYRECESFHRGRVLLVGDAAGLVDPLLGEGIRHAVDSGKLAADAILMGDLSGYTRNARRQIGGDLLWGRRWAQLFYKHPRASFELGVRNPHFLQEFLRLFAEETTYRQMAARALFTILRGLGRRRSTVKREA